jgi:D-3-phosphoglycerate dehydrogenase
MKKVLVTDYHYASLNIEKALIEEALAGFDPKQLENEQQLAAIAGEYDAFLNTYLHVGPLSMSCMKKGAVIVRYGIGVDNIELEAAKEYGIRVCNVPDYGLAAVSEYALGAITGNLRQLSGFNARIRDGNWDYKDVLPIREYSDYTIGLLGFGGIGRTLAGYLRAIDFQVIVYDPFVDQYVVADADCRKVSLNDLLPASDVISLHMPLVDATHHIINAETIARMKDGAMLVNTARGPLVDPVALSDALNNGKLSSAVLDVFEKEPLPQESPLYSAKNLTMTPHVAWYTDQSTRRLQQLAAEEIVRAINGESLRCPLT